MQFLSPQVIENYGIIIENLYLIPDSGLWLEVTGPCKQHFISNLLEGEAYQTLIPTGTNSCLRLNSIPVGAKISKFPTPKITMLTEYSTGYYSTWPEQYNVPHVYLIATETPIETDFYQKCFHHRMSTARLTITLPGTLDVVDKDVIVSSYEKKVRDKNPILRIDGLTRYFINDEFYRQAQADLDKFLKAFQSRFL